MLNPCQLPFLGSIILPRSVCSANFWTLDSTGIGPCSIILMTIGLTIFEFLVWFNLTLTASYYVAFIFLAGIFLLLEESSRIFSSIRFTNEYRELQILENLLNSCVRYRIFQVVAFFSPICQILGGITIIKFHSVLNLSHLIFFFVVYTASLVLGWVLFSGSGIIYVRSVSWLSRVKCGFGCNGRSKIDRRALMSMAPLRVWFGSNFVDCLTPLVIQHFCLVQTVTLLLLR